MVIESCFKKQNKKQNIKLTHKRNRGGDFKISPEVANFQYFGDTPKGSTSETSSERQCFEQTVQIINIKINKKPS